jgi:hypothetical protein
MYLNEFYVDETFYDFSNSQQYKTETGFKTYSLVMKNVG